MDDLAARRRALNARIPRISNCQGRCWNSCTLVPHTEQEGRRVLAAGGDLWLLTDGQTPAQLRRELGGGMPACPSLDLDTHLCKVYRQRPVMCRLWGTTRAMTCEYGCTPDWWLTWDEASAIIEESAELDREEEATVPRE